MNYLVRKGGVEPPPLAGPDPKSGASANSATFACQHYKAGNRKPKQHSGFAEKRGALEPISIGTPVIMAVRAPGAFVARRMILAT